MSTIRSWLARALVLGLAAQAGLAAGLFPVAEDMQATGAIALDFYQDEYVLKGDGSVWQLHSGAGDPPAQHGWEKIEDGPGNRAIRAGYGRVYLLKESGEVLVRFHRDNWMGPVGWLSLGKRASNNVQLEPAPYVLYTLEPGAGIFECTVQGKWKQIGDAAGVRAIVSARGDPSSERRSYPLFMLKETGNVFQYSGTPADWKQIDDGTGTFMLEAAVDTIFVVKEDGNIWRRSGETWTRIHDGTQTRRRGQDESADGVRTVAADPTTGQLAVLKSNGEVWVMHAAVDTLPPVKADPRNVRSYKQGQRPPPGWAMLGREPGARAVVPAGGTFRLLMENGDIAAGPIAKPPPPSRPSPSPSLLPAGAPSPSPSPAQ